MDFILNGQANGDVASVLLNNGMDTNLLRPFIGNDGRSYINRIENGTLKAVPIQNTTATLRKDEWISIDTAILKAAKPRLKLISDLRGRGLTYMVPNGMGTTVLQTETQSDISAAEINMDAVSRTHQDRPQVELTSLPLPIIHKDFSFTARQLATSRTGGSPLDTTTAELASRRVSELMEQLAIGSLSTYQFGGGTVYGLINYNKVLTKTITAPTASSWTGALFVTEVLAMRKQSTDVSYYGPWVLYVSPAWDQYLDADYSSAKGDNTLRERVKKINGIQDVITLDYLTGNRICLMQTTTDVMRLVIGMEITTVQWPSLGGLQQNFKVMGIVVPQPRADYNSATGIVSGNTA